MNHATLLRLKNKIRAQRGAGPLIIVLVVLALVVGLVAYLYSSGSLNLAFGNNKRAESFAESLRSYGGNAETAVANLTGKGFDIETITNSYNVGGLASSDSDVKLDARSLNRAMFDKIRLVGGPATLVNQNFLFRVKRPAVAGSSSPYRMQYLIAIPFISNDVCNALPKAEVAGSNPATPNSGAWLAYYTAGDFQTTPGSFGDMTSTTSFAPNKTGCLKFSDGGMVFMHTVADVESQ